MCERERERERDEAAVNSSEFLWSGLVRSFGQDRRLWTETTTLRSLKSKKKSSPENRSTATTASIGVTISCATSIVKPTMTANKIEKRDVDCYTSLIKQRSRDHFRLVSL